MIKSPICDILGIKYPVFQGGMAWASNHRLAAAVSNAGGLGIIGAGQMPPELVVQEIRKAKENTDKPFGVNLILYLSYIEELIDAVIKEKVAIVTTGAGNAGPYIKKFHDAGIKVIPVIPSTALAKRMEKAGADAVIAEGTESGGHIGEITTMALVPQVADAVNIPVIAAGGIADYRGFAAALCLGASGIQMGTRFLATKECHIHQNWKNSVIKASDRDTVVTGRPTGHPVRVLKNKLAKMFLELEEKCAPIEEYEKLGTGKLKAASVDGDAEMGSLMSGQIAGLIKEEKTVKEVIDEIVSQTEAFFKNAGKFVAN
ncbi:MAG: enoyl-[acyl-carrier-protein] reductase FabK [Deltaproteobacteria bacterium]|jgi:enoyl-[acyl-carrier protein] reductase II|uniref:Enoyl-[acyl-carrier-protein] reductase FabK n=1 Tax=Candidatus Acidulodesulfobacterium acidiphilum TaxID=2597224 RepID=A0A520XH11_9DELT|nr:enoyl-[acyl-carrier-protein] reductase FabK [Deltaproteobacteria bacterium]RZV40365.1 MAG: enoyl-[acyl-carrier-protein] reductase FabK [Candidatus Acidulodesulfobacterium acidiphilum]